MQSSSQSAWCLPNLHKFQLPADGGRTTDKGHWTTTDCGLLELAALWRLARNSFSFAANNERWPPGNLQLPKLPLRSGRAGPGRLLWAAVRCNYVVQLISTQREAAVVHVVGRRVGKGGEREDKGLPMCSVCICALCRGHLCNLLSLMAFNVPSKRSQAKLDHPLSIGHLGDRWNLCKNCSIDLRLGVKMLNRRRDQAGRPCINQAVNMTIYAYVCVCLYVQYGLCKVSA